MITINSDWFFYAHSIGLGKQFVNFYLFNLSHAIMLIGSYGKIVILRSTKSAARFKFEFHARQLYVCRDLS